MKNVLCVYNTKYGNCKKHTEEVGDFLKKKFDVKIVNVKETRPKDLAKESLELIVAGFRITMQRPDGKVTKFLKKLRRAIGHPIPKMAALVTHRRDWEDLIGEKVRKAMNSTEIAEKIFPDLLNIQMTVKEGPAVPGQKQKIKDFCDGLINFIET
jgi:menaquinone-dependent protoporphyrinogen IX oxidase